MGSSGENIEPILPSKLRIYTAVWGQEFIELFEKTILNSFSWPQNFEALKNENVIWSVHTKKCDETKVIQAIKKRFDTPIEINILPDNLQDPGVNTGAVLLQNFNQEIQRCLDTNSRLLLAPPDSIFGDGTLRGLFLTGAQDGVCVAVAHPRVLPEILDYPEETLLGYMSNAELVSAAWRHLHRTWSEAELNGEDKINSYVGGVQWKKLKKGLYSTQHRLPTTYLIHFRPNDLQFFSSQVCFGAIDHLWPSKLIDEERQRTVGSSDSAFICEVTKAHMNVPPSYPVYKQEPDKFWRSAPHNKFFRQISVIFRGTEA